MRFWALRIGSSSIRPMLRLFCSGLRFEVRLRVRVQSRDAPVRIVPFPTQRRALCTHPVLHITAHQGRGHQSRRPCRPCCSILQLLALLLVRRRRLPKHHHVQSALIKPCRPQLRYSGWVGRLQHLHDLVVVLIEPMKAEQKPTTDMVAEKANAPRVMLSGWRRYRLVCTAN